MPGFDGYLFQGVPFHGEFSATDATTQVNNTEALHRFALYPPGSTVALSVGASDTVIITDAVVRSVSADNFMIYDGPDINADTGENLIPIRVVTNTGFARISLTTPVACQAGTYPKIIGGSTTAQLAATITGVIKRGV